MANGVDLPSYSLQLSRLEVKSFASRYAIALSPPVSSYMTASRELSDARLAENERRSRQFTDDLGQTWLVSEQPFSDYDRRSGFSLIFSSELAVRRVRNYPSDWFTLSEPDLAALSWRV
jgi:hypothetical protein